MREGKVEGWERESRGTDQVDGCVAVGEIREKLGGWVSVREKRVGRHGRRVRVRRHRNWVGEWVVFWLGSGFPHSLFPANI